MCYFPLRDQCVTEVEVKVKTPDLSPSMASSSSSVKRPEALSLSEDLTCAICYDLFKDPVMLGCMHHFCKPCITAYWGGIRGPALCPQCRKEFPTKQFQTNYLVAGLVEKVRASSSSVSGNNLQVKAYCSGRYYYMSRVIPYDILPYHSVRYIDHDGYYCKHVSYMHCISQHHKDYSVVYRCLWQGRFPNLVISQGALMFCGISCGNHWYVVCSIVW